MVHKLYLRNSSKYNHYFIVLVYVLATAAVFFRMSVCQVLLRRPVSNHRRVVVGCVKTWGASGKAQIPLCRLCDKVRNKFPTKSWTQIMKVRDINHVADFHYLCPRLVPDFVTDLVADFPHAL